MRRESACCWMMLLLWWSPAHGAQPPRIPALPPLDFNRLAAQRGLPLLWGSDTNANGLIDPDELELIGPPPPANIYVKNRRFTDAFKAIYRTLVDDQRLEAIRGELASGRPTLIRSKLAPLRPGEREMIDRIVRTATLIDRLYYRQTGAAQYLEAIEHRDATSRALFRRNAGPWCVTAWRDDAFCNALPSFPVRRSEMYPVDVPQDEQLCQQLAQAAAAERLLDPFTVVRRQNGRWKAIPLVQAFAAEMSAVAKELEAAATALEPVATEQPLRTYLAAAAAGFRSNRWQEADAAWVQLNTENTRWYVRVAPDETSADLCHSKAAFHLVLGRVDHAAAAWKRRVTALMPELERRVATLVGPPYRPHQLLVHTPDFIELVLNAGDSRRPYGAAISQTLPNFGALAERGKQRTIVVTNLHTDVASRAIEARQAHQLLAPQTFAVYDGSSEPALLLAVLHEAGHALGPAAASSLRAGRHWQTATTDPVLAARLEEVEAVATAMWALDLLRRKQVISRQLMLKTEVRALIDALTRVARLNHGRAGSEPRHGQAAAAAMQLGMLIEQGALRYESGRFALDLRKTHRAYRETLRLVGRLVAAGTQDDARAMLDRYLAAATLARLHLDRLTDNTLRETRPSFCYSVSY